LVRIAICGDSQRVIMNWQVAEHSSETAESYCAACPLSQVRVGMAVRIKQLCAAPAVQTHLRELGFCEDRVINLLTSKGNFICQICNARFAISAQLAKLILVESVNGR
jgi:Fe2+ transport system protein FeoA